MAVPRVVVTGMGAVTCQGLDADATWDAMVNGRSGIRTIVGEEYDRWKGQWPVTIAGQVRDWDPYVLLGREANRMDRYTQLGMHAAIEAWGDRDRLRERMRALLGRDQLGSRGSTRSGGRQLLGREANKFSPSRSLGS
jgi:3-oxoacyl-[acyl-carrier-protein] synthase II